MKNFPKAVVAGLIATIVLSLLFVIKDAMGIMPQLDLPKMIAGMMGMPDTPMAGWAVHFFIGVVVYGAALALLDEHLPGDSKMGHGVLLATVGWLMMMVGLMPMAGAGFFGLNLGISAPIMTLILHLIFGAILGAYYGHALARQAIVPSRA